MEKSLFQKLKNAYADSMYGTINPDVTDVLLRQKDNKMEIVIHRKEKECEVHPAALGYMVEEDLAKEWRLSVSDAIELNVNRFLYGHTPMFLYSLKIILDSVYPGTELVDEPSAIMVQELLLLNENGESMDVNLTECTVFMWGDSSKGDPVGIASFRVVPTLSGIEIKEMT